MQETISVGIVGPNCSAIKKEIEGFAERENKSTTKFILMLVEQYRRKLARKQRQSRVG